MTVSEDQGSLPGSVAQSQESYRCQAVYTYPTIMLLHSRELSLPCGYLAITVAMCLRYLQTIRVSALSCGHSKPLGWTA